MSAGALDSRCRHRRVTRVSRHDVRQLLRLCRTTCRHRADAVPSRGWAQALGVVALWSHRGGHRVALDAHSRCPGSGLLCVAPFGFALHAWRHRGRPTSSIGAARSRRSWSPWPSVATTSPCGFPCFARTASATARSSRSCTFARVGGSSFSSARDASGDTSEGRRVGTSAHARSVMPYVYVLGRARSRRVPHVLAPCARTCPPVAWTSWHRAARSRLCAVLRSSWRIQWMGATLGLPLLPLFLEHRGGDPDRHRARHGVVLRRGRGDPVRVRTPRGPVRTRRKLLVSASSTTASRA